MRLIDSAGAAARLLLVVAALAGFLAMHGLAATDSAGAHHLASSAVVQHDTAHPMPAAAGEHGVVDWHSVVGAVAGVLGSAPAQHPAEHDAAMAGCVFILLALAGAIALRAWWTTGTENAAVAGTGRNPGNGTPRAPPCPIFVSLCVFRL